MNQEQSSRDPKKHGIREKEEGQEERRTQNKRLDSIESWHKEVRQAVRYRRRREVACLE